MLKVYNTLTRKKEVFKPIKGKQVNIFVCGPTVYNYIHAGNAKTYAQFDMIVKYLRFKGFKVFYLQNITDIDDRIIKKSQETGEKWDSISKKYEKFYKEDMENLGVDSVNKYASATNYIPEIISQVKRLIEKGYAYKISDGWYFDLKKDKDYGKLARKTSLDAEDAVSRIDESKEKRNSGDFCLWKFSKPGEPIWKSKELGDGRPGWHIEDTAITEKEFGPQYDIHGGGMDLIFPHHEAEIAQMESISGEKPLVRYWFHTGFLNISKEKMSKSKGNFKTLRELLEIYGKNTLRYFFASTNYRKPIDFSEETLENAKNAVERLRNIASELKDDGKTNKKYLEEFENEVDNELNFPNGLAVMWKMLRDEKADGKLKTINEMNKVFCFNLEKEHVKINDEIKKLIIEREKLRKSKKWAEADKIREKINKLGFVLEDTDKGVIAKKR
ncbi:MAG: cysteine--tRNA ligase [Candidatus Pacearchaeota archaeon]|jgi:cysteinyl-tRNA synthetase